MTYLRRLLNLCCLIAYVMIVGFCPSLEAGTWTFWLPWPSSRIERVYPDDVTPWPIPGYLPNYEVGYFRGYDVPHRAPRTLEEGAWSRDYFTPHHTRPLRHRWWRSGGSHISHGPRPWPFW